MDVIKSVVNETPHEVEIDEMSPLNTELTEKGDEAQNVKSDLNSYNNELSDLQDRIVDGISMITYIHDFDIYSIFKRYCRQLFIKYNEFRIFLSYQ